MVGVAPARSPAGVEITPILTERLAIYRPEGTRAGSPASWGPWVLFPEGSHTRAVITAALHATGASVEVVAEYEKTILNELDLLREAANATQLRRNWQGWKAVQ